MLRYLGRCLCSIAFLAALPTVASRVHADMFVASGSGSSSAVLRFNDSGSFLDTFVGAGNNLDSPRGLAFGPDGNLYISNGQNSNIQRYNGLTGAYIDTFVATGSGGLLFPEELIFRPDGYLYVEDFGDEGVANGQILRYNATTGVFVDTFVTSGSGGLVNPDDIRFGTDNKLYVSNVNGSDSVLRYQADGSFDQSFAADPTLVQPRGIDFDAKDNLYVTTFDQGNASGAIVRFDSTGGFDEIFSSGQALLMPRHLAFGPDGNLYVADQDVNQIDRFNGVTGAFMGTFASGNGLDAPTFFVFRASAMSVPEPSTTILLIGFIFASAGFFFRHRSYLTANN